MRRCGGHYQAPQCGDAALAHQGCSQHPPKGTGCTPWRAKAGPVGVNIRRSSSQTTAQDVTGGGARHMEREHTGCPLQPKTTSHMLNTGAAPLLHDSQSALMRTAGNVPALAHTGFHHAPHHYSQTCRICCHARDDWQHAAACAAPGQPPLAHTALQLPSLLYAAITWCCLVA